MQTQNVLNRFTSPGPKRILSLDGGGMRGALTLGMLKRLEEILRERYNRPDFRLYEYFDLIGGTSTGSIIASGLAIGMSVDEIKEHYFSMGDKIFPKKTIFCFKKLFWIDAKTILRFVRSFVYDNRPLIKALKEVFKEIKLGGDEIKTGLAIIAKRMDTNSTWVMHNNPNGKYFKNRKTGEDSNNIFLLRELIQASAAAPTYFQPISIDVGGKYPNAVFIDGGVSLSNNPSLQLFFLATLKEYKINWEKGDDKLFLCSFGTGSANVALSSKFNIKKWAELVPELIINDATEQNQMLLQYLSKSPNKREIDREVGNLENDSVFDDGRKALTFLRYNINFDEYTISPDKLSKESKERKEQLEKFKAAKLSIFCANGALNVRELSTMDSTKHIENLFMMGYILACDELRSDHFEEHFDIKL